MIMPNSIIYREKYGASGPSSLYVRHSKGASTLVQLGEGLETPPQTTVFSRAVDLFTEVFLPQGYPESVRNDYSRYQIWDTVQAFCSTISSILTTHAIMKSVGVGDATASALSATITWVLKDGIGMIGRIIFAWSKGHALDTDLKKWRLFADMINDIAMFLELLLLPLLPEFPTHILCLTTTMKGIVGVAGGASRAAITQHHAIRGNNGDVSAKDGSQETCVNLVASSVGVALLPYTHGRSVWLLFFAVTFLHLFANYKAVRSLALVTFNSERLCLYLRKYLYREAGYSPQEVNTWESVVVGCSYRDKDLCGFHIKMGCSVSQLVQSGVLTSEELLVVSHLFQHRLYLLVPHYKSRTVFVLLSSGATTQDILQAYFHSVLVAASVCHIHNIPLEINREINKSSILNSVQRRLKKLNSSKAVSGIPLEALTATDDVVENEFRKFLRSITSKGWNTESHSLLVEEWRGSWCDSNVDEIVKNK